MRVRMRVRVRVNNAGLQCEKIVTPRWSVSNVCTRQEVLHVFGGGGV